MQQYTCPKCSGDYTEVTRHKHIKCGTIELPKEPEQISENLNDSKNSFQSTEKPEQKKALGNTNIQPKKRGRPARDK